MKLSDNPKDELYQRVADSLCHQCGNTIEDKPFDIVYSDIDGVDAIVHAGECREKREEEEERDGR